MSKIEKSRTQTIGGMWYVLEVALTKPPIERKRTLNRHISRCGGLKHTTYAVAVGVAASIASHPAVDYIRIFQRVMTLQTVVHHAAAHKSKKRKHK